MPVPPGYSVSSRSSRSRGEENSPSETDYSTKKTDID
jgi:hypothetical protein